MRRVLIVGTSGSGKSTVGRRAASRLGIPHVELDALFHGPGWVRRPTFQQDVAAVVATPAWLIDGNYSAVREMTWAAADTVVWLDLPRWLTEWQVVSRTFRRLVLRTTLWNGNRERFATLHRASHPIRWSWRKHSLYRQRYAEMFDGPASAGKQMVRLRSRREVAEWINALAAPEAAFTPPPAPFPTPTPTPTLKAEAEAKPRSPL